MSGIIPIPKDNASAQLNAGINASSLSIVLKAGEGANFPQPINGAATSLGSATVLNCTGIQALGVAVGDIIYNLTDSTPSTDSWAMAVVTAVSANSVTTTPLDGGSDNLWESSDDWVVKPFVVNASIRTGGVVTGAVTQYEKVLITDRSTDTLSIPVASGYRGFDGTTPNSFSADDWITIEVDQSIPDGMREALATAFRLKAEDADVVHNTGAELIGGVKTFDDDGAETTTDAAPTSDKKLANKKYVDDQVSNTEYADDVFRVVGSVDDTKKIAFDADTNIATGETRVITMPDEDVDLGDISKAITIETLLTHLNLETIHNALWTHATNGGTSNRGVVIATGPAGYSNGYLSDNFLIANAGTNEGRWEGKATVGHASSSDFSASEANAFIGMASSTGAVAASLLGDTGAAIGFLFEKVGGALNIYAHVADGSGVTDTLIQTFVVATEYEFKIIHITEDGTEKVKFYVDGANETIITTNIPTTTTYPIMMKAGTPNSSTASTGARLDSVDSFYICSK